MYALIKNNSIAKYPYSKSDLWTDNPNTSFPVNISDERLREHGVYPVNPTEPPSTDYTQNVSEDLPVFKDGEWVQTWKITNASTEDKTSRLNSAWSELRSERNQRLTECDWTQLPDSSVDKVTWAAYRMALRFLPEATQDPFNPVWPVKPS